MDKIEFELFLRKENKKIYNYLLKILRNSEDAEDVMQDVFISFYKKVDSVKPIAYESYLFRTAYHKALNFIKKNKKKKSIMFEMNEMDHYAVNEDKANSNNNDIVHRAMQNLSLKDATIIELKYFQKKNYSEIAEILSITSSAVDSKLVRARRKLKKIISQEFSRKPVFENRGVR
ncbi:MAG: sigma-70 family RNA polymerase sigma factor [Candidatus Cloacimonetes bacterium]|nr:sigma-70 family RNA polymerase sigma factor [Candidatus Cloacimonadota bacterium]